MKKNVTYFALIIFAGITILLLGSYSKWFNPEVPISNASKKEEYDTPHDSKDHREINLRENLVAGTVGTSQLLQPDDRSPTATLNVNSADLAGSQFAGMWVEVFKGSQIVGSGFTPFSTTVEAGVQHEIHASNFKQNIFDHWDDGSANAERLFTIYQDTTFTISYKVLPPPPPSSNTMQIIVVPYFETSSPDWQILYSEADENPGVIKYVIINPCSGPCGETLSEDWQGIISELKRRNIKTLGYVFDTEQSIENIDHYMKSPTPTDGIFFDNEGARYNNFERFKQYAEYVKNLGGIVYINPGFNYPYIANYLESGLVDVANVYEFEASKSHHIEIDRKFDPRQMSVQLQQVYSTSEMIQKMHEVSEEGIGIIYIFSDTHFELPSYFPQLIKAASETKIQSRLLSP